MNIHDAAEAARVSDHTIAARVRAEPSEDVIAKVIDKTFDDNWSVTAVMRAYRAMLLADESPLTDEQISDRSAP